MEFRLEENGLTDNIYYYKLPDGRRIGKTKAAELNYMYDDIENAYGVIIDLYDGEGRKVLSFEEWGDSLKEVKEIGIKAIKDNKEAIFALIIFYAKIRLKCTRFKVESLKELDKVFTKELANDMRINGNTYNLCEEIIKYYGNKPYEEYMDFVDEIKSISK